MENLTKLRPYLVLQILNENTDENHTMTIAEILKILEDKYGIKSYRATIKEDIELLQAAGCEIEFIKSSQNHYNIIRRDFDIAELKVLIDAVESAKFITKEKSLELVSKLSKLAGPFEADSLKRNIEVERRIKGENGQIYYIVDAINEAINSGRQISFQYFRYNVKKERKPRHDGDYYRLSPYRLVWNGDYYYVVGYSEKHGKVVSFRGDRIVATPEILEEAVHPSPEGFDLDKHLNTMFRMFSTDRKAVELICSNDVMDSIIDRFGEDVQTYAYDMENFRAEVEIAVNSVFYSWVFGFGGKVKIKSPKDVKEQYRKMIENAMDEM